MEMTFKTAFINTIKESLDNNFDDNYDYFFFGKENESREKGVAWKFALRALINKMTRPRIGAILKNYSHVIEKFEYLYGLTDDKNSKEILVKILAYRILGYKKVKLYTNTEQFWKTVLSLENIFDRGNFVDVDFMNWRLYLFDLAQIGWPIKIYYLANAIYITFVARQYDYNSAGVAIKVEKDDIAIDAGGGWGDTALRFAHQAGRNGKVYSFEFIPSNLALMRTNIKLNPELENRIEIVQNALWSESGMSMYCHDDGPASSINSERNDYYNIEVKALSIDDFVEKNNLQKVDFIKMDIEGAELRALKGAEKTIRKYRPKLAISLYHKPDDFGDIPKFIELLDLGYKYYVDHYTIHVGETVLYASTQNS